MAFFLLENLNAKTVQGSRALVVQAETAADARAAASAHFSGDSSWANATTTALTASTLDDNASMLGWTFKVSVTGAAGQTADPIDVSVVGTGTDDLDAMAAKLVTALNATEINGAAYAAPNLTVCSGAGGDDNGDGTVIFKVIPPSGNGDVASLLTASITHEGAANAALTIALVADTESIPKVAAEVAM